MEAVPRPGSHARAEPRQGQVRFLLVAWPATLQVVPELLGVILVFSCWNNPLGNRLAEVGSLAHLSLGVNQLEGEIPAGLGLLSQLRTLYIHYNNLVGSIPPSLGNLTLLQILDVLENKLVGSIPVSLSHLDRLVDFEVGRNNLSGTIPPLLFNKSSLLYLGVASNKLHGSLPADAGTNLPGVKKLLLGNNRLSGTLPSSLGNATMVEILGLGLNRFQGRVAPEIGKLCPFNVEMSANELQAEDEQGWEFFTLFTNCTRLQLIDLPLNRLGGVLPTSITNFSTQIQWLSIAANGISGVVPSGLGNLINLSNLDMGENDLHGVIPEDIAKLTNLQVLLLANNQFSGNIPSSFGNLTQLQLFSLSNNSLDGPIPRSLGNLKNLPSLDLSSNLLTGFIPTEIFGLPSLTDYLLLSDNYLSGVIPAQVGSLKNIQTLNLSKNNFSGEIPAAIGGCVSLVWLGLADNSFTGSIPNSFGNLRGLNTLNLSRNSLSGTIPQELGNITGLQELFLAHNHLSGMIPKVLESISNLVELDLSFNILDGEVPTRGVFANMTGFSMAGNHGLCGGIRELELPPCQDMPQKRWHRGLLRIVLPIAGTAICISLLLFVLFLLKWKVTSEKTKTDSFIGLTDKYPRVSYLELFEATDGFAPTNLVGEGKYGSVYKGSLSLPTLRNTSVAVKVFTLQQSGSSRSFLAECEALRQVKHRNLIDIITCCSSVDTRGNDFQALVFEFMPNYSLDRWLHQQTDEQLHKLNLIQLLNIAVDVADAIDYLHNNSRPSVIHCDLKPNNILLDSDWTAYVADFGLSKLIGESMNISGSYSGSSIGIRGTVGYVAPEYGGGGHVSTAGDAYSFGVTLLEMFTGRAPTDDMFIDGLSLHLFAEMALPDKLTEIVDAVLLEVQPYENTANYDKILACLASVVRVGISCSKQTPSERMSMKDAAIELHGIRDVVKENYV
ncbi:Putative leucine-rich repeat receptor-like protein kinase family protein [Zea mays]|nr:Putative leucine-rich repeat receptor-like protein kinase family protein [Zea mays]